MDSPNSNNNTSRGSKLQNFKGNVSPLNTQRDNNNYPSFIGGGGFHHPSISPTLNPYTGEGFKTPAVRIGVGGGGFGSSSPLRAGDNLVETPPSRSPQVFNTPVKVEGEDVLVMDGYLVGGSGSGGRMRFPVSSDSSGGMSSSGSNSSAYKRDKCWHWERSGYCSYGTKCQFVHGQEELHQSRFPRNTKSEICRSYSASGSCSYGANCRFSHHLAITASSPTERAVEAVRVAKTRSNSPSLPENLNDRTSGGGSKTTSICITDTKSDWSPMDDGIKVSLPSSASSDENPSREAVDAHINSVLYGPSRGKRLPVFAEICPESTSPS